MRYAVLSVTAVFTVLALQACSTTTNPTPTSTPSAAPQSGRPKVVSMIGIDPCSTLTNDQIAHLNVQFMTRFDDPPSPTIGNVRACTWVSGGYAPHASVFVQGVTYRGFSDVSSDSTVPASHFELRGFPALTRDKTDGDSGSCEVFVDVADGQTFEVAYDVEGQESPLACQRARQAAEFGMTYLLNR